MKMPKETKKKVVRINLRILMSILLVLGVGCDKSTDTMRPFGKPRPKKLKAEAVEIVQNSLLDKDPKIRAKAIEAVALTKLNSLMPEVERLLQDDYVPVRFSAALAVGDTRYHSAMNSLKRLLRAPDENTRIAASYAMYKLGYRDYLEYISQAVKSNDQTIRANAVVLLGKSKDKSVLKLLYWAKDDDNSELKVRYQAAEAIAKLGDKEIFPKLWTMLISKYVDNKIIGIRAMGALGTAQAKEVLLTKLDDDILEVRLAAAEQLGMLGDTAGEPEVLKVFDKDVRVGRDKRDLERINVLTALAIGQIGTPPLTKHLPDLMSDESKLVRIAAAQGILLTTK